MMSPLRILAVMGTRPEVIKLAPVIAALRARGGIDLRICSTGQHREMLTSALEFFGLMPDFRLDVMRPGQPLPLLAGAILSDIVPVLESFAPHRVLVQGDTATAFATALAAWYFGSGVCHVEAGLRTPCLTSPFPEEMHRRLITNLTEMHFAPTDNARTNLLREGVPPETIHVTGNTIVDALYYVNHRLDTDNALKQAVRDRLPPLVPGTRTILATCHRRENHGQGIEAICRALLQLAERRDIKVAFIRHLNPQTAKVNELLAGHPRIDLLAPQDYPLFVALMQRCDLILTDSGGLQEEAPYLGKPTVVLRQTTERPEGVECGTARLVGVDTAAIAAAVTDLLDDPVAYACASEIRTPYGDGTAAHRIAAALITPPPPRQPPESPCPARKPQPVYSGYPVPATRARLGD